MGCVRRVVVIAIGILFFGSEMNSTRLAGAVLTLFGVFLYDCAKKMDTKRSEGLSTRGSTGRVLQIETSEGTKLRQSPAAAAETRFYNVGGKVGSLSPRMGAVDVLRPPAVDEEPLTPMTRMERGESIGGGSASPNPRALD
jgi:hypothetical protein